MPTTRPPALQARPLCGAAVLDRLEWQNGSWRGTLYDPQNGTDYTVSVDPVENGAVRVTGHSGRPVLSRTMVAPVRDVGARRVRRPLPATRRGGDELSRATVRAVNRSHSSASSRLTIQLAHDVTR